jgi:hypothetical protein
MSFPGVYPTMYYDEEFMALLVIWLGFMSVAGFYVVRIGLMLREQRIVEQVYRMRLAALRGKAVREMAESDGR